MEDNYKHKEVLLTLKTLYRQDLWSLLWISCSKIL